jgi:hypothetical protein
MNFDWIPKNFAMPIINKGHGPRQPIDATETAGPSHGRTPHQRSQRSGRSLQLAAECRGR